MIIADQSTQSLVVPGGEVGRGTEYFGTVWYAGRHATRRTVNHAGSGAHSRPGAPKEFERADRLWLMGVKNEDSNGWHGHASDSVYRK